MTEPLDPTWLDKITGILDQHGYTVTYRATQVLILSSHLEGHVAGAFTMLDRIGFTITPRAGHVERGHYDTWESVILNPHGGQRNDGTNGTTLG